MKIQCGDKMASHLDNGRFFTLQFHMGHEPCPINNSSLAGGKVFFMSMLRARAETQWYIRAEGKKPAQV